MIKQNIHETDYGSCQVQHLQRWGSSLANVQVVDELHPLFWANIVVSKIRCPGALEEVDHAGCGLRDDDGTLEDWCQQGCGYR